MTRDEFLSLLDAFAQRRLSQTGYKVAGENIPKFPYRPAFINHTGADLMMDDRKIGSARWVDGALVFDPPIAVAGTLTEGHLIAWAATAQHRADTTPARSSK
jgi:hypothetical protein